MRLAALAMLIVVVGCDAAPEPSVPPSGPQPATIEQLLGPWSATPYIAPPGLAEAAERACKAALGPDSSHPIEKLPLKVVDVRGAGVAQAFLADANAGTSAACYEMAIARDGTVAATGGGGSSGGGSDGPIAPFEIRIADTSWSSKGASTWGHLAGPIGAAIARVEIVRPGQNLVTASIANGWFAAWVPELLPPGWSVRGFDANGAPVATAVAP